MKRLLLLTILIIVSISVSANDGLIRVKSAYSATETMKNFEQVLLEKGMTVFLRIDHIKGAQKVGVMLRPSEVIIFGNPKIGTKLMQCTQSIAIDLPLKALVSEDKKGQVWLSYNDPYFLAQRHALKGCEAILAKMTKALDKFSRVATKTSAQ